MNLHLIYLCMLLNPKVTTITEAVAAIQADQAALDAALNVPVDQAARDAEIEKSNQLDARLRELKESSNRAGRAEFERVRRMRPDDQFVELGL